MENKFDIAEEATPTDTPAPTKLKSKKGIIIGITAIAVVAIILIAFMLTAGPGVEGKWTVEKSEILNPDGSVNSTFPAVGEEWMEILSNGTIIYGNNTEIHDYNMSFTWEYINNHQIEITTHYNPSVIGWNNVVLTQESQLYEYEVDGDTLTLGLLTPHNGVTLRMTLNKA